jgi:di/tricarboxylate transporter
MNINMLIVLSLMILAVVLFIWEKITPELTALVILVSLVVSGVLTPSEGLAGFSNPAAITVGAMFILSAALQKTGFVTAVGLLSARLFRIHFSLGLLSIMVMVSVLSAFINNTPVVAIFIPIMLNVARKSGNPASRLLMPVSYASIFGGVCTLIGTSTNILVNSIAVEQGLAPIGMFDFTPLGILLMTAGTIYMMLFGIHLLPRRPGSQELVEKYRMNQYLTDVQLLSKAPAIGKKVTESSIVSNMEIDVLDVIREGRRLLRPLNEIILAEGDTLRVRCDIEKIRQLQEIDCLRIISHSSLRDHDFDAEKLMLVETIIAPNSGLIGHSIKSSRFRNRFAANALALRHRGQLYNLGFRDMPLDAGDAILVEVRDENYEDLKNDSNFVIISDIAVEKGLRRRSLPVMAVIAGVVFASAMGLIPIVFSALIGCLTLLLFRLISVEEALAAVDWRILLLLAGMIPLGTALQKTGAATLLSKLLVDLLRDLGPVAIVAALFLITSLLTEMMSNNATALLLTPIAIAAAVSLGLSPKPFIMTVAFASSASFMTPIGYQTNTMIYGIGQYRFVDFIKVGTPLNLIFWFLVTLFVPVFYPF